MKYLMGRSKYSGSVYAGLVPDDASLEPEVNRVWEKEITEQEYKTLNLIEPFDTILCDVKCTLYKVKVG